MECLRGLALACSWSYVERREVNEPHSSPLFGRLQTDTQKSTAV